MTEPQPCIRPQVRVYQLRIVAGADAEGAIHLPLGIFSIFSYFTGHLQLEVIKLVRDFGAASGELVVESDREFGPRLGVFFFRHNKEGDLGKRIER